MIKIKRKHYKVNLENPIKNKKDDIFGYDYEVKRIKNAIDEDANVIGIVSEYGSGKSSLIELLIRRLCILKYKIIKVNLWDNKLGIAEVFDIPEKKKELPAEALIIQKQYCIQKIQLLDCIKHKKNVDFNTIFFIYV